MYTKVVSTTKQRRLMIPAFTVDQLNTELKNGNLSIKVFPLRDISGDGFVWEYNLYTLNYNDLPFNMKYGVVLSFDSSYWITVHWPGVHHTSKGVCIDEVKYSQFIYKDKIITRFDLKPTTPKDLYV